MQRKKHGASIIEQLPEDIASRHCDVQARQSIEFNRNKSVLAL